MPARSREIQRHKQDSLPVKGLQESVSREMRSVPQLWFSHSRVMTFEFSGAATIEKAHGLGGAIGGAFPVDLLATAGAVVWRASPSAGNEATHVAVSATVACTVKMLVWR